MRTLQERYAPFRENNGSGGGQGGQNEGNQGGGGNEAQGWTPPQGLPAEFAGADANETLTKLLGGFTDVNTRFEGLRTKIAQAPKAPDTPDAYTYTPSETLKPYFSEDPSKDPAFQSAKSVLHGLGVPVDKFGETIEKFYKPLVEAGVLPQPFNPAAELKTFMDATGMNRTATQAALTEAETFAKGLTAQLKVPDAMKEKASALLIGLTDTAEGNILLRALSSRLSENGIRVSGDGGQQGNLSAADLAKLDADPRIDPRNRDHKDPAKRFDPDLRKRYDAAYDQIHKRG